MSEAKKNFDRGIKEAYTCLKNFELNQNEFALRHVWIVCVSSFDLYMTELVSEAGLRWIDRTPPVLTANLREVRVPLGSVLDVHQLTPVERLLFYKDHVYVAVQYTSFYKPDKISEALSYIWVCPAKEKWARICKRLKAKSATYTNRTEEDIRNELTLIGDRRDLIAHSSDTPPGATSPNPVVKDDAERVIRFVEDMADAVEAETEEQLNLMVPVGLKR